MKWKKDKYNIKEYSEVQNRMLKRHENLFSSCAAENKERIRKLV